MKTAGIITEFNPFHNGHKYIIDKAKREHDAVVVIMSGSFVQRGEAAVTDKWTRAAAAIRNGADLVIELPVIYALNTAQKFAYGAIETLNKCGIVDDIVFGSESGNVDELIKAAELLENESQCISEKVKKYMSLGMNYPSAREQAYTGIIDKEILSKPNNILAVEYLRALLYTKSKMKPYTIQRTNDFHGMNLDNGIASATAIRSLIMEGKDFSEYVPEPQFDIYMMNRLDTALISILRMKTVEELKGINDVSEGLENRIAQAVMNADSFEEAAYMIKTKRYTLSRIRRVLLSSVLSLTSDLCSMPPSYIRVLGMNGIGRMLLREMKKKAALPVVIKTADFAADDIFKAEIRATDFAALACLKRDGRVGGKDYKISPVVIFS